ncbi:MAG: pilus assembly protein TadG [Roseibium sp.]|nr:pilus assembly protein TadG [Roseibium sp.]
MVLRIVPTLIKALRRYLLDTDGSVLPISAVVLVLSFVIAGAGVDYTIAVNQREKMAHALDAAALTVATQLSTSVMTDAEIRDVIEDSFRGNLKDLALTDEAVTNLNYVIDPNEGTIDISTTVSVNTYFIKLGGIGPDTLNVGVGTQVAYSRFDVELALVVDVTGSMSGDMNTLREASEGLVDVLIPDGMSASDSKVRISLVPYSEGVNVATYASAVTNGVSSRCVTERMGDPKLTDIRYDWDPDRDPDSFFGGGSSGCSSSSELIPLTSDRNTLIPAIRALSARGGTAGQTGTAWGWYTISPNWTNLWPAASDPEPYTEDDVLKFAILMTDGNNNRHYDYKQRCQDSNCWWEWDRDSDGGFNGDSSQRARQICENMKAEDITIYGVYFGPDNNSVGARNMQACATDESTTYYQATSSAELISAFGNIARKIQAIYLAR